MIDMGIFKINLLAVILVTILNMALAMAWYGGLFAKPWTTAMGYDPNMRPMEPIGYITPAEAEANYYAALDQTPMAA